MALSVPDDQIGSRGSVNNQMLTSRYCFCIFGFPTAPQSGEARRAVTTSRGGVLRNSGRIPKWANGGRL